MSDETIRVRVRRHEEKRLKVTWSAGASELPPYFVDPDLLQHVSTEVRQQLGHLGPAARKGQLQRSGRLLKQLAIAGQRLYQALLPSSNPTAVRIRDWIARFKTRRQITFNVGDRIHIPWGLIYADDPNGLPGDDDDVLLEHYEGFWCIRHSISAVYCEVPPTDWAESRDKTTCLFALNESAFQRAVNELPKDQQQRIKTLVDDSGHRVNSQSDFVAAWKSHRIQLGLVYFYCHADETRLAFSETDQMDIYDLKLLAQEWRVDLPPPSPCLLFLNGCSTAIGTERGGFLEASGAPGLCGFIGTEAKVPDIFALQFGAEFLDLFVRNGGPVSSVLDTLRTRHWPLSLLYHLCADPDFAVSRAVPPTSTEPSQSTTNYSFLPVGSQDMTGGARRQS